MINGMKYIVLGFSSPNDPDHLDEVPIIFPATLTHASMKAHWGVPVVSAGMVTKFGEKIKCWGESTTLMVQSRKQVDADLITQMIEEPME